MALAAARGGVRAPEGCWSAPSTTAPGCSSSGASPASTLGGPVGPERARRTAEATLV